MNRRLKAQAEFTAVFEINGQPVTTPAFPDRDSLDLFIEGVRWALARFKLDVWEDDDDEFRFTVAP